MKLAKSNKTKFVLNPILIAMLGLSAPLAAQASVHAVEKNDNMTVVTANRSAQSISDIAATVLVIEEAQIAEQAKSGVDFKALLANLIPSLDVGSQSRTNSGQNMRGRKTLVMIDGISLNSSRSISRQFDSINPFNIARIEVISGASAMYGGGSTGGIINIITKKGRDADGVSETWLGAKSGFNGGDDLEWQVAQSVSMNTDKVDARLAVSYVDTGAMYDSNGDMVLQDVTQTSTQFNSQLDIMGNLGFKLSSTKRLELMAQYYDSGQDSEYGVDYGPNYGYINDPSKQIGMVKGYELDDQAQSVRSLISADYSDADFFGQTLNLQLFHRTESLRFNPFPDFGSMSLGASEQETQVMGAKLVLTSTPVDALNLVYGVDADYEKFNATQNMYDIRTALGSNGLVHTKIGETGRYPDIKNTSFSGFLQADYQIVKSLSVNAGVRYQYIEIDVSDFVAADQQYKLLTGQITSADAVPGGKKGYGNTLFNSGLLFKISQEQQLWFNFSQAFEVPDPAKYYGRGTYDNNGNLIDSINVSNNPLEGVKTNALELGWRLNQDSISAQLVTYYSVSDKKVQYNKADQTVDVVDNDVRIYGLEGQLDYYLTGELSLGANFNYIISEAKESGVWQDLTIDSASPSKASAYVAWQDDSMQARLQTMQMFTYEDSADNKLEGYNTVDLLTGVTLPVGALQFGITNLLNTDYDTLWSQRAQSTYGSLIANTSLVRFQGQGRTYSVNYSVEF